MDTLPQRGFNHAGRQHWVATSTSASPSTKGLSSVAVACLAIALLVLTAFVLYAIRRRGRAGPARWKRGRNVSSLPQIEAELVIDDPRRGGRGWPRRNLPALLLDRMRGLSFGTSLEGLWRSSGEAPEREGEEADVVQYSSGRHGGAGPRVLAATASGKALQVVVKTAAVPARQQKSQLQEQKSAPTPTSSGMAGLPAVDATPGTPMQRHESRALDLLGPVSPPYSSGGAAAAAGASVPAVGGAGGLGLAGPSGSGSAGAALGIGDTRSTLDDGGGSAGAAVAAAAGHGHGHRQYRSWHSDGPRASTVIAGGAAGGAAPWAVAGDGGAERGGGGGAAGDASTDPAAAWYSRALHRQVSTTAIATQLAAAAGPKPHLA